MNILRPAMAAGTFGPKGLCAASLLLLLLPLLLSAQTGAGADASSFLDLEVGDSYEYEGITQTEIEMQLPFADSAQTVTKEMGSLTMIEVNEITDDEIVWDMTSLTNIADDNGLGGGQIPLMMTMTTDRRGQLKKMSMGEEADGTMGGGIMSMMMNNSNRASQGPGWFMPEDLTARKIGERWDESLRDTVSTTMMASMGFDIQTFTKITYTYEGTVDTLGVTAARLSWVVDKITFEGSFDMSEMDMEMTMSGKGSGKGIAYYSLVDKGLLAQSMEMKMDQTIEAEGKEPGTMKMKMSVYTDQSRQD